MSPFSRTFLRCFSRRITLPQLSPSHTKGRILQWERRTGDEVVAYDPMFIVECSPDMITVRDSDSEHNAIIMMVDTQEEGIVRDLSEHYLNQWIPIGTELGVIDDGDPVDGDWTWQAYLDDSFVPQEDKK